MNKNYKNNTINLILLVVIILLIFFVIEFSFRIFYEEPNFKSFFPAQADALIREKQNSQAVVDPVNSLVYDVNNNKVDKRYYVYGANDRGKKRLYDLRDYVLQDEKLRKNPGAYRVGVIGDSHTCGGNYTSLILNLLNDQKSIYKQISEFQVFVFCDQGINTIQELVLLEELAINYDLDFLILQYCDNDIQPSMRPVNINNLSYSTLYDKSGAQFYVRSNSGLFITNEHQWVPALPYVNKKISAILLNKSVFFRFISYKTNIIISRMGSPAVDGEKQSFDALYKMSETTKRLNIPFALIDFVPARKNYCTQSFGSEGLVLHNKLANITKELGITYYNMCDYVDGDIYKIRSGRPSDDHYNKEGNKIAAEILAKDILSRLNIK